MSPPGSNVAPMTDFSLLQSRVAGPVRTPADDDFAAAVSGFNLFFQNTPHAVVGVMSTADVAAAVAFAAANDLHITVQATGHGLHHTIEGGLLIDTSRLDAVTVDADARIATIGAGARWAAVVASAAPLGLAPVTGSSTNVGVVGYLLGGGLGPLSRSHGFSSDYLVSATVVTPDGEVVEASADTNPDLLWALRGGKGGFGVVTEIRLQLVDMPSLYAGSLMFPEPAIEAVLRGWIDYTKTADDRVTTSAAIYHFPPVEQLPPHLRGQTLISLRFAFPGERQEGEKLAAPLRALGPVIMDQLGALPTSDVALIHGDPTDPGPGWGRGALLNDLDGDFATVLLAAVGSGVQTPIMITEMRHLGAATRVDVAGGSSVGGRASGYTLSMIGAPNPALFDEVLPGVTQQLLDGIARWVSPETSINFVGEPDLATFVSAWPPATFERLEKLRAQLDPKGLMAYGPPRA